MSRHTERTINARAIRTEGDTVEPQSPEKPTQSTPSPSALHEGSDSADMSPFDTYRKLVAERMRVAEIRRRDAEDLIHSAALLSATVAVFTGVSVPGLKPDPGETSAYYLARAAEIFANASGVQINLPYIPSDPAKFSPSTPVVWVNSLWFMSLALSLLCIPMASSMQRWALRYGRAGLDRADQGDDELRITRLAILLTVAHRVSISFFYAGFALLIFDSLRIYLGNWPALLLSTTSTVGPIMLLLQTT